MAQPSLKRQALGLAGWLALASSRAVSGSLPRRTPPPVTANFRNLLGTHRRGCLVRFGRCCMYSWAWRLGSYGANTASPAHRRIHCPPALWPSTPRQRTLDLALLQVAAGCSRVRRDSSPMAPDCRHHLRVLASASARGTYAGALCRLGELRHCSHAFSMAAQPLGPWLGRRNECGLTSGL